MTKKQLKLIIKYIDRSCSAATISASTCGGGGWLKYELEDLRIELYKTIKSKKVKA